MLFSWLLSRNVAKYRAANNIFLGHRAFRRFRFSASPSAYRGQYPIAINFNDERGQFNTYRSHCSKLVSNKSYPLVTHWKVHGSDKYVRYLVNPAYLAILTLRIYFYVVLAS